MKKFLLALVIVTGLLLQGSVSAQGTEKIYEGKCQIDPNGDGFIDPATGEVSKDIKYCIDLQESIPIGDGRNIKSVAGSSGVDLFANYVGLIYKFGAIAIGLVCVLIIVISGIQMIAGGVNSEGYTQAKTRMMQAILSMVLLFASAMILRTINPNFFT
jgi:outer membrane murein-binding lipoprotein Lpp